MSMSSLSSLSPEVLASTPGMTPPDGQTSDFDAPFNSLQIGTVIAFGVTYFFCTVFLGLRYFQSLSLVKKVELDLIIVTLSYAASLVYFVTMVNLMNHGWGKHLWDVSLADLIQFNKGLLPNTLTYLICPSVTKMAMLAVLFQINPSAIYRLIVAGLGLAIFTYCLVLCIITGAPCNPLKSGTTTCLENVALSQAVLNIASDIAVLAVPMPTIFRLQLKLKQKLSLAALMAAGSGVVICSIARLPYVLMIDTTADTTWTEAILGVWSIVEVNLGIICACAMRLKPLVVKYLPQLGFSASSRERGTGYASRGKVLRSDISKMGGQHSYQLHSIQKNSNQPVSGKSEIRVYHSYKVDVDGDGASTDKILD